MGEAAVRVKICGVRRPEDARLASALGADAIGVLVGQAHPSGDFVDASTAAEILRELPERVCGVLVSHLVDPSALLELIGQIGPGTLQIHSAMAPEAVQRIRRARPELQLHKAVHINIGNPLETIRSYESLVDGFVIDSCNPTTGQVGGTGLTHDWRISAALVRQTAQPLWLAGGLNPSNVAAAIAQVKPAGVDVNSGVKGADGTKNPQRLKAFIQAVNGCTTPAAHSPR
jgi:phosphoribosylanthranilate isomerase